MKLCIFAGRADYFGFTGDALGINLPIEFGPWKYLKAIDLQNDQPRVALQVTSAIEDIEKKGWHVNRAGITFEVRES